MNSRNWIPVFTGMTERPRANAKEAQSPKQLSPKSFNLRHSRENGNPDVVPVKTGIQYKLYSRFPLSWE
jgi:hypothetical protein